MSGARTLTGIPVPLTGIRARMITGLIYLHVVAVALRVYRSPWRAWQSLWHIIRLNKTIRGGEQGQKYYRCGRRFFWSPIVPQWPSRAFVRFVEDVLDRAHAFRPDTPRLDSVIMAVSSRCPLACEHCLEGDNLSTREHLSLAELHRMMDAFRRLGVVQVFLSGGEPTVRCDDVCSLIAAAGDGIEFTMLTSGHGLTAARAVRLRRAGLRAVNIALDHWDEARHNRFRGRDDAYAWARTAAVNARHAGLLVGFSLCAVEDFVTWDNLWRYLDVVRSWGGVSVRILEPRPVGRYAGRPVALSPAKVALLDEFYQQVNTRPEYASLPRLSYPEFHKRAVGCFGAGNRLVYADSRGDIHACPFCHGPVGNVLRDDLAAMVAGLRARGCAGCGVLVSFRVKSKLSVKRRIDSAL